MDRTPSQQVAAGSLQGAIIAVGKAFNILEEPSIPYSYEPATIARVRALLREMIDLHNEGARIMARAAAAIAVDARHKVAAAQGDRRFQRFMQQAAATGGAAPAGRRRRPKRPAA